MSPPIRENYGHRTFDQRSAVENTILMSLAMEDMKSNPSSYKQIMKTVKKKKFEYHVRHGHVSPARREKDQEMVDLAQGIKQFRTSRKMSVNVDNASMPNESSALLRHDSQMSKLSRLSLKPSEAEQCEPLYVVFIEDGTKISSQ